MYDFLLVFDSAIWLILAPYDTNGFQICVTLDLTV